MRISKPSNNNFVEEFMCNLELAISQIHNRIYTKNGQLVKSNVSDVYFRGQRDARRSLISALDRLDPKAHHDKTTELLSQFIPHDKVLYTKDPVSQLSYLQHNGVATPLLDWTKKPSTALYYAMSKYITKDKLTAEDTAALFILDPYSLNEKYRISKYIGVKVGGIALSENFDAVIRARHPLTHSFFELSCDTMVKKAAESSGLMMTPQDKLCISCLRTGAKKKENKFNQMMSGGFR